jgi:ribonuclease E
VIVRTAAEGATEEELSRDVARLAAQWEAIEQKSKTANAPELLYSEPDLTIRVVRDIFNEDFASLVVAGDEGWDLVHEYVQYVAPHLAERLTHWADDDEDAFARYRIDEQLAKALERKVWLPSGGSLVIDNTEAMTVVDVNTGKFTGQGGNLEETVTRNNLEAAEEIVRQLRLRDVGGIIVIDFIDMVLESNRELVLRRMLECLARDRTKHQVAEVTSLGLVQMTRKRVGAGLLEAFSEPCDCCNGRGRIISLDLTEPAVPGQRNRSGGDDGRQGGGGRQDRNGRADRNSRGDKNGQDKNGQDKNSRGDRSGRQDRNGHQDRATDEGAAAAPDGGAPEASEPAAAAVLVGGPGERQGGRRRRRSATRPQGAPDAELVTGAEAVTSPDPSPASGAGTEAVASLETGPTTQAVAGADTVPGVEPGPATEASLEGEAPAAAEAVSAVSSWPAGEAPAAADAAPALSPAPAWDSAPASDPAPAWDSAPASDPAPAPDPAAETGPAGETPAATDGDSRPAGDGPALAVGGSHPADEGPATTDEEHPPF